MRIVLILPSLAAGGLEKVITELTWYFSKQNDIQVYLVILRTGDIFYPLPSNIEIFMPSVSSIEMLRPLFLIRLMSWLRKQVENIAPDVLVSFGGKYNAFVFLAVYGLCVRIFVSDRSRPSISYGRFLDYINPRVYKKVSGIISQTEQAKTLMLKRTGHPNIRVIGNPLRIHNIEKENRDKVILNVGRFIPSKQQGLLVKYFAQINPEGWKIWFIGDGSNMHKVKQIAYEMKVADKVIFCNVVSNVEEYYERSSIFAFTSVSEGFPNALGEAMAAGQACISFDCEAGPSDLIDDGVNGFLIPENDHETYKKKLKLLINDESLRNEFGASAKERVNGYSSEKIGKQYLDFFKQSYK